jgi:hypothetical protein
MRGLLRRLLLRIGYALPLLLRGRVQRWLYDAPLPTAHEEDERLQIRVTESIDADLPVVLTFLGGCRDGEVDRGVLARLCFWDSRQGQIGARFTVASDASVDAVLAGEPTGPILRHEYEIVENKVIDGVRQLRAKAC